MSDPYGLRGRKLCSSNLYFNTIYASSNFYIYSLCHDAELNNCSDILAKVYEVRLESWKGPQEIKKEIDFMKKASDLGVSPRFVGSEICSYNNKDYYVLIMENYGNGTTGYGTLSKLLLNFPDFVKIHHSEIQQKLKYILDKLYDNGIYHNDLHSGNFLYKINQNGEIDFKIIDFDSAHIFNPMKNPKKYIIEGEVNVPDFNLIGGISRRKKRKTKKYKNIKRKNKKSFSKKCK
jgi:hypothetical protein